MSELGFAGLLRRSRTGIAQGHQGRAIGQEAQAMRLHALARQVGAGACVAGGFLCV